MHDPGWRRPLRRPEPARPLIRLRGGRAFLPAWDLLRHPGNHLPGGKGNATMGLRFLSCAALVWLAGLGCSPQAFQLPQKHIPTVIGPARPAHEASGLVVTIQPDRRQYAIGEEIGFEVTIVNAAEEAFWIDREIHVLFLWTYPDGTKDNYLLTFPEQKFFQEDSTVCLRPGEARSEIFRIRTDYFRKPGITEFRAVYFGPRNTNPRFGPSWYGRAVSNSFGVYMLASS